jgi:hypothetical protein
MGLNNNDGKRMYVGQSESGVSEEIFAREL